MCTLVKNRSSDKRIRMDLHVYPLIFALSLATSQAWGIRESGLAEMQIQSLFSKIKILSQPCLQSGIHCGLNRDESKALRLLLRAHLLDTQLGDNSSVAISAHALYVRDGEAKDGRELATMAFAAWINRGGASTLLKEYDLGHVELSTLARKIFSKMDIATQTIEMSRQILIHRFNFKNQERFAGADLFMETKDAAVNITPQVMKKACRTGGGRLLRVVQMSRQGAAVDAKIVWQCRAWFMAGTAVMIPMMNSKKVGVTINSLSHVRNCEPYL